jgi:hypothetical protein
VINSYHNDPSTTALLQELAVTETNVGGSSLFDGVIRYNDKSRWAIIIASFHGSAMGGGGVTQVYKLHITD